MSRSEDEMNRLPAPSINEIENLLYRTKPRPTSRLHHKLSQAPWYSEQGEFNVIRLKKLEFAVTGAALLLFALVAAVIFLEWSPAGETTTSAGTEAGLGAAGSSELNQGAGTGSGISEAEAATATPSPAQGALAWAAALPGGGGELDNPAAGIAYETGGDQGRLFAANGIQGVEVYSQAGEHLMTIAITDPETGRPVFVRDVAWSELLWLGPPEQGLVVLTDPFESGQYLHIVDPESGAVINSFTHNSNIALPATSPLAGEQLPTQLSASGEGELYVNRVFTFSPETSGDPATSLHYLLRLVLDGRILNPMLVSEEATAEEADEVIADLAYQTTNDLLYAAVHQGRQGVVQKYDLNGTPRLVAALDGDLVRWQEGVALATDGRGHVFILVDGPGYVVELDQGDQVVNIYGFEELAAETGYPAVSYLFPGGIGRPLAMTVAPDGSMLFIMEQTEGRITLSAFTLAGS